LGSVPDDISDVIAGAQARKSLEKSRKLLGKGKIKRGQASDITLHREEKKLKGPNRRRGRLF